MINEATSAETLIYIFIQTKEYSKIMSKQSEHLFVCSNLFTMLTRFSAKIKYELFSTR